MKKVIMLMAISFLIGTWFGFVGGHFTENERVEALDRKVEAVVVDSVRYRRYSESFQKLESRISSLELRVLVMEKRISLERE